MKKILAWVVYGLCSLTALTFAAFLIVAWIKAAIEGNETARDLLWIVGGFLAIFSFAAAWAWAAEELDI